MLDASDPMNYSFYPCHTRGYSIDDIGTDLENAPMSSNVNHALQAGKEMGLLAIGYAGRDGGRMPAHCDYCFVVPSFSIPRIQETQETLLHIMWDLIHVIRGQEDVL